MIRGVRGATTVENDLEEEVLDACKELLLQMQRQNAIRPEDLAAVIFTVTPDIKSAFPAKAARLLGWTFVPLIDAVEPDVENAPTKCIRVLMLWNVDLPQDSIKHVYLRNARSLRPDLTGS
ncbi:MAG TPA: chorismate mutase [Clostridia bacterium]|nr:chorismate mutase [Clostridia bacterium]